MFLSVLYLQPYLIKHNIKCQKVFIVFAQDECKKKATGHRAKVVPNQVQRVTETEMSNYVRLSKYFKQTQYYSKSSHPGLIEKLIKLYNKLPPKEFLPVFQACLRVPFLSLEKDPAVSRTMEFTDSFCTQLNVQENERGERDLCLFLQKMFKHLLKLVNLIFSGLGEGMALEEDMAGDIREAMLKRMQDKVPAIRAQALLALKRLQYPVDPHCKVIQASVRRQTEIVLLPAWFNYVNKDYVTLLRCLDLDTENGVHTCQLVIDTLFKEETSEGLVAAMAPLL